MCTPWMLQRIRMNTLTGSGGPPRRAWTKHTGNLISLPGREAWIIQARSVGIILPPWLSLSRKKYDTILFRPAGEITAFTLTSSIPEVHLLPIFRSEEHK